MREPAFWWREPGGMAGLLAPLSYAYGAVAAARLRRPGERAGIPVLCVGNFTVGGAGKTPTALAVARWLEAAGGRPFFLTRGFGGRLAGPVQVALDRHDAAAVGDEPLLLARVAPTIVARDRPAGAALFHDTIACIDGGTRTSSRVPGRSISRSTLDRPLPAVPEVGDVRSRFPVFQIAVDCGERVLPVEIHRRRQFVDPVGLTLVERLALRAVHG